MGHKATFLGDGAKITIEVFDYENPLAQDPDDASWLKSELAVHAGPFSGAFKTALTTHDLAALYQRIYEGLQSLSERVSFQTTEGDLDLNIDFFKSGKAQIQGVVQPHGVARTALNYQFQSDIDRKS